MPVRELGNNSGQIERRRIFTEPITTGKDPPVVGHNNKPFDAEVPLKILKQIPIETLQEAEAHRGFHCPKCNFDNHPSLLSCEMCGILFISQDSDVDSNPISKSKHFISSTISKDNTQGEYARNSKLLADFGRKIRSRGHGDCFGEGMMWIKGTNLKDQSPLSSFTHSEHIKSTIDSFDLPEWPGIRIRSLHHTPA
jgi:hypothetical protein